MAPGTTSFGGVQIAFEEPGNLLADILELLDGAVLSGSGTLTADVINDGGTIDSNASVGSLTLNGDYTQTANGRMTVKIGGPIAGSDFDQIIITGVADLLGAFATGLSGGYSPALGDEFEVVTFGSRQGAFTEYIGLDAGANTEFVPLLADANLTLQTAFATGPRITDAAFDPGSGGAVPSLTVTFDEPVDRSSFRAEDAQVTGPLGSVEVARPVRLDGTSLRYRVDFAEPTLETGAYTALIGPDVLDFVGNPMNQDEDGTNGEVPDDVFNLDFNLTLANLGVTDVTLDTAATQFGTDVRVTWTVENNGDDPAIGPWSDRIYLSADNVRDSGDVVLATTPAAAFSPLASTDSYTTSATVTPPIDAALLNGAYFILVETDTDGVVSELDITDNTGSAAIELTVPALPDLQTSITTAPAADESGSQITVEWTTTNNGTAATADGWTERIFLSYDDAFSAGDRLLAEVSVAGPLATTGSVNQSVDVQLPIDLFADAMSLLVVTDAADDVEEHVGEADNVAGHAIDISLGPIADLGITLESVLPGQIIGDPAPVDFQWTVTNNGTGPGVDLRWDDVIIASSDNVLGNRNDIEIARFANPNALDVGQSYSRNERVFFPPAFTGTFFIFVQTDADADVFENGLKANNAVQASGTIDVMPIPFADLAIAMITVPADAESGEIVDVAFTVENIGIGQTSTGHWVDRVAWAADPAGTQLIAEFELDHFGPVGPGGQYERTASIQVPNGFSGPLYAIVTTAVENGPFEFGLTANNSDSSSAISVTLAPAPDLTVTAIQAPATAQDGQVVEITWTVINTGTAKATGNWEDLLFLESVADPDAPVLPLGSFTFLGPLAVGQTYTRTESITITNEASGEFSLVVAANHDRQLYEDNTANNPVANDTPTVVTLRPRADIVIAGVIAPASVDAGGSLTVEFEVRNAGTAATTPTQWQDKIFLSLDDQITNDDISLGVIDNAASLDPGDSYITVSDTVVVPERLRGSMFILILPDADHRVDEFPNEDNLFRQPIFINPLPLADLVVSGVIVPVSATSGSTFDVTFSLDNLGSGPTNTDDYTGQIWLTLDRNRPNPNTGDVLLRTFGIMDTPLAVNEGLDITQSVTIPQNIASGIYHITPWVDPFGAVLEDTLAGNTNPDDPTEIDNNNYKAQAIDIIGILPDLEVISVTAPAGPVRGGDTIAVSWTVANQATGIASGRWVDRVYLSTEADPLSDTARSLMIGEVFHNQALGVNETYSAAINVELSPSASGQFIVVVTDDTPSETIPSFGSLFGLSRTPEPSPFNVVEEVFEDNNATAAAADVTPVLADLVVTSVTFEPILRSGEPTRIRYTVQNQGADALWAGSQFWRDFLWIGQDAEFIRLRASYIGEHTQAAPASLAPGESYEVVFDTVLPQGLDGDYNLFIHLDAHNDLSCLFSPLECRLLLTDWFPGDTGDNTSRLAEFRRWAFEDPTNNLHNEPMTVEFFEPDLRVTDITPLGIAESGKGLEVQYTVSNEGTRATRTGKYTDRIFLSHDPSLDSADLLVGSVQRSQVVDIGAAYTETLTLDLPEGVEGSFYLIGYTDSAADKDRSGIGPISDIGFNLPGVTFELESLFVPFDMADFIRRDLSRGRVQEFQNEGNNIFAVPLDISLAPAPDLRVASIDAPAAVFSGQTFDVTFEVVNSGTAPVPPTEDEWESFVLLSVDDFLDVKADTFLELDEHEGVLDVAESVAITLQVQAPADFSGTYNLFAVTDPVRSNSIIGDVFEGLNERNNANSVTLEILPPPATDLQVMAIRIDPLALKTGDRLQLEWDVVNTSGDTVTGRWSDVAFLSTDSHWDIRDRALGRVTFNGTLAPGGGYTLSLDAFLPSVTPGAYFVIIRNDIFNQVFEGTAGETNNVAPSSDILAVSAQQIELGVPFGTTLNSGQERLLQLDAGPHETLRVTLTSSSEDSVHELFLRQGTAPTSTDFDADYEGGLAPDVVSVLPSTDGRTIFILIRGQSEPLPETPVTVLAEVLPLIITGVQTDTGGDGRFVTTTIRGARFNPQAAVNLVRPGFADIQPAIFEVLDATKIIATFDLTGRPRGLYDVKVTNPDGGQAIVPYRFLVERAIQPEVTIGVGGPRIILAGDVGTYSVALQGIGNLDTPYMFFQVGIPEMGRNINVYNLDYLHFFSNVRGAPPGGDYPEVPFASLNPAVNLTGQLLTSGYVFDQQAAGFDGVTFNVETYPGLRELNQRNFEQLRERIYAARPDLAELGILDDGPEGLDLIQPGLFALYKAFGSIPDFITVNFIPFQFHVVAAATTMTRGEFVAHALAQAEQLRQGVLDDPDTSAALLALAADRTTWGDLFLAALEAAGVLRPEGSLPPIRENALIQSLMSVLATGLLGGPAGDELQTGDPLAFFDDLRRRYGHDEDLPAPTDGVNPRSGNPIPVLPDFSEFDLGLDSPTHFQVFRVYSPWIPFEDRGAGLPPDFQISGLGPEFGDTAELTNLDLSRFLTGDASATGVASITGPFSAATEGFIPAGRALPYTINFQNDPVASSYVHEVRIVADLDEQLDTRTFRLGDIRVGDISIDVPAGRGVFQGEFDFLETRGFLLRVSAGVDLASNEATWLIQAIDPVSGEILTDPHNGLLPPNNALGDGFGFVSYTIEPERDVVTGDEISARARIFFDGTAPEDTETLTQTIDAVAPTTNLTVTRIAPGQPNFTIDWNVSDDAGGAGFRHVTLYVAENGGDFAIWQRQLPQSAGSAVFVGDAGTTYEFLALATDRAGNREAPPLGILAQDDGSNVNLGFLTELEQTPPNFGIAPVAAPDPSTNAVFIAAEWGEASTIVPTRVPEYETILLPFAGRAFATGIGQSHAFIGPMAMVEAADGSFIISGGAGRNELYRIGADGGGGRNTDCHAAVSDLQSGLRQHRRPLGDHRRRPAFKAGSNLRRGTRRIRPRIDAGASGRARHGPHPGRLQRRRGKV